MFFSEFNVYMESSNEGRLGLQQHKGFHWKGKTFYEVTSILQKNKPMNLENKTSTKLFFKSMPLKHYRSEIVLDKTIGSSYRNSQRIRTDMETPGGTIVQSSDKCTGNSKPLYFHMEESKTNKPCSSCDDIFLSPTYNNSTTDIRSLSQKDSALRRVRSAGMNRPRFNPDLNNRPDHYNSSAQYLHGRNKTFQQNQFNLLRVQDPADAAKNVYASNTIQYCGSVSSETQYVPVYHKPNNGKFGVQGAVEASSRLARLKYDTITDAGSKMRKAYGEQTANALSYGVPANGYTIKDKMGYPNTCTPIIKKDGTFGKC